MSPPSLLLVEDDQSIALLLEFGLEADGFDVTRVANLADARTRVQDKSFQIAVLDVNLPDGSGFELCKEFREAGMRLPILMLTGRTDTYDKVHGLEVGADDYLEKPFDQDELVARLRALLRRTYGELADTSTTHIEIGDLVIDLTTQRVTRAGKIIHLTATEFKLLAYLAQNPGMPFNRQSLLEDVWGYDEFVGDARTVDVHIRNLRQKIELDAANPTVITTVRGSGYMMDA
jgi:DNA-binding response OmpR family regulator